MPREVYFELVDAATRLPVPGTSVDTVSLLGDASVFQFRREVWNQVKPVLSPRTVASSLRVYTNRTVYDDKNGQPMEGNPTIGALGASEKDALIVEVPPRESDVPLALPAVQIYYDGVNPQAPHLAREELLKRVYDSMNHRFILFLSPAASGKTSLLSLFARRYTVLNCIRVSFFRSDVSAADLLQKHGIDIYGETTSLSPHQNHVVMIDDAQAKYADENFWTTLIKVCPSWLPDNVRFIICATHALQSGTESPVEFKTLRKFCRSDFLLSDEEAQDFLVLPPTIGLPDRMKKQHFIQLLVRECSGLVGALRISVDSVAHFFAKDLAPSENELVVYYLSQGCLEQMARCFGSKHTIPTNVALQQFLIDCLVVAPNSVSLGSMLADEDNRCLVTLKKAGILVEDGDQLVKFSSPLAEKYYCRWLFPNRAVANPSSLHELITKVVGNMSASVLQQSVVAETYFPKEATFQHMFMEGLALNTHPKCLICPELSRVYPSSPADGDQPPRIQGEIDFYLNGSLRWGLELLVNGIKIGEHASRFAPDGKYAPLKAKDYAVIDLRGNETGKVTNVTRMEKRVTVFFKLGDFTRCCCIFGKDKTIHDIPLKR